jgi:hypothetical protein
MGARFILGAERGPVQGRREPGDLKKREILEAAWDGSGF